ncbi:SDR family NAD(P)-dependent oxidoreductase [Algoriphagus boritolerans]|uniref:NAD(P)-dependent dehydrogenase, short-chain alcohol dehydrogenase family n=1 Tax=Algoriphagus boritolerans DSM 17298 = JCM 18970 TaxID=1120964 RepID=A0A1H5TRM2_9BACT|nr:glucose 1-dehydrogenase [Algoriphagus boritolerans]SEF65416.1 NAD(P)-dependent dehydrogenase, short-chain alcohol dehydrogenase family [Algoriphagus boritolerans DSM 17298 = JCM 18970]
MKALDKKVAIITGSGSGIGKAAALLFAKEGATVIVSDIQEENGRAVAEEIKSNGGNAIFFRADTSQPADNEALVKAAIDNFGKLDIAVNNAGIGGPMGLTGEYPIDGWQKVIEVNLSGVFYGMHYQLPAMEKNGGGVIVNIASILGMVGTRFSPAYVAAKHGVVGLTKATALEYAPKNIRVNSIGPGYIMTPLLTTNLNQEMLKMVEALHPIGRLGEAEEVAELILWLSSSKSSFVTGSYYPVDGGYLAQ